MFDAHAQYPFQHRLITLISLHLEQGKNLSNICDSENDLIFLYLGITWLKRNMILVRVHIKVDAQKIGHQELWHVLLPYMLIPKKSCTLLKLLQIFVRTGRDDDDDISTQTKISSLMTQRH